MPVSIWTMPRTWFRRFIRIHKSYIVPAWRIERSSAKEVFLSGLDGSLPVGRAHAKEVKNNV